jgi:hypothetical protein
MEDTKMDMAESFSPVIIEENNNIDNSSGESINERDNASKEDSSNSQ